MSLSRIVVVCLVTLASAPAAGAAPPVRDLAALRLPVDMPVEVTPRTGGTFSGRFVEVTADVLVVRGPDGERRVPATAIRTVAVRGDRLRNGVVIGAVVGALSIAGSDCACDRSAGWLVFNVPVAAAFGALIDRAHHGHTVVYRAP